MTTQASTESNALPVASELINSYLRNLSTERGLAEQSVAAYTRQLTILKRILTEQKRSVETVDSLWVRREIARLHQGGLAASSIAHVLSSWRGFFNWLAQKGQVSNNPCQGIRPPRKPRRLPKALTPDQAQQLMEHGVAPSSSTSSPTISARDRSVLELLYGAGLRVSEMVGLDTQYTKTNDYESSGWLAYADHEVHVLGKGNKRRMVPIGAKALEALNDYLKLRSELQPAATNTQVENSSALFLSPRGKRMSVRDVQRVVSQAGQTASIAAKVHPHVLRHSFASHILQSSSDLRAVQELLGHANITTTQIYTSLDFQRLAAVYDAAHPRAHQKQQVAADLNHEAAEAANNKQVKPTTSNSLPGKSN